MRTKDHHNRRGKAKKPILGANRLDKHNRRVMWDNTQAMRDNRQSRDETLDKHSRQAMGAKQDTILGLELELDMRNDVMRWYIGIGMEMG